MSAKKTGAVIGGILSVVLAFAACGYWWWSSEYAPEYNVSDDKNALLYVYPEMTIDDICQVLENSGFTKDASPFHDYMERKNYANRIKTGCYRIENGMNNRTLAQHLIFGMQEPVKLRLNNVRLNSDLALRLSKQLMLDSATICNYLNDTVFLSKYGVTPQTALTLFIPNTYEVYWDMSIDELFERMQREHDHFWNEERKSKAQKIPLTTNEVYTLASIVDEETNVATDKPIIAGLYINRLHRGMPLQACPTARYALGDFTITYVTKEHTLIDSPYNTYKFKGLPPGPIRMASICAIDAVLNYTKSSYIYMCASDKMDGTHNFATNFAEHSRNAARYKVAYKKWAKEHNITK